MTNNINTGTLNQSLQDITAFPNYVSGENVIGALFYISNMTGENIQFYDSTDSSFEWFESPDNSPTVGAIAKKPPIPLLPPSRTSSFVVVDNNGGTNGGTIFYIKFLFSGSKYELKLNLNGVKEMLKDGNCVQIANGSSVFIADLDTDPHSHLRLIWGYDMAIIEIAPKDSFTDTGLEL